jgi:PadR family transcriptional regulator PadR
MNVKGILPLLILKVLAQGPGYGYQILSDIRGRSQGVLDYNEGALYPVLYQLERDGLVETSTEVVSGRVRRFYMLTSKGHAELARQREDWRRVSHSVNLILEDASL